MALRPVIQACVTEKCSKIVVTDVTGVYHVTNNPYGWETPNTAGSDVDEVLLTITDPAGTETETDLTSQIPATVTGDIEFTEIEDVYTEDGIYTFTYTITAGSFTVTKVLKKAFFCESQCCVDKMWAKIPEYINTKDEKFLQNYIEQTHYVQGLINGASAGAGCLNTTAVAAILDKIDRICNFENCQCD